MAPGAKLITKAGGVVGQDHLIENDSFVEVDGGGELNWKHYNLLFRILKREFYECDTSLLPN